MINNFFFFENHDIYEVMWEKNCSAGQTTDGNMAHTCWIPNATNTHSEYVTLIDFLLRQWLHECPSM